MTRSHRAWPSVVCLQRGSWQVMVPTGNHDNGWILVGRDSKPVFVPRTLMPISRLRMRLRGWLALGGLVAMSSRIGGKFVDSNQQ
ncbi:hypothetical protein NL676_003555 [Syzygium grande]|nr:hypothetical protein NL676_003555 [Syzygium grande]